MQLQSVKIGAVMILMLVYNVNSMIIIKNNDQQFHSKNTLDNSTLDKLKETLRYPPNNSFSTSQITRFPAVTNIKSIAKKDLLDCKAIYFTRLIMEIAGISLVVSSKDKKW